MSTDQEFEQEWEQVKAELSKLKGCTVRSLKGTSESHIENIDQQWGIRRRSMNAKKSQLIDWEDINRAYRELHQVHYLTGGTGKMIGYGAFVLKLFSMLTTVCVDKEGRKTILRYLPEGRPPRLKDG